MSALHLLKSIDTVKPFLDTAFLHVVLQKINPLCCCVMFFCVDHSIDFGEMDLAVNAVAGALKAFFADLPDPLIPYSLHPELVEAASKNHQ